MTAGNRAYRLLRRDVPERPSCAKPSADGDVYDMGPHRWRYDRGRLVAYIEYWPDYRKRVEEGRHPWRALWTAR